MYTDRAEQDRLINEWTGSGLSLPAFARSQGIPYSRMSYWVRQRKKVAALPVDRDAAYFAEVAVPAEPSSSSAARIQVRVTERGRVVDLGFSETIPPDYLIQVLRGVLP